MEISSRNELKGSFLEVCGGYGTSLSLSSWGTGVVKVFLFLAEANTPPLQEMPRIAEQQP